MTPFTMPKFPVVKESLHTELRKRVQQYFDENNISATGNMSLFTKAIVLVASFVAVYVHLIFFTPHQIIELRHHGNYYLVNVSSQSPCFYFRF